ncbi:MAG: radical SAM protein [Patescibacteria group bacterium]
MPRLGLPLLLTMAEQRGHQCVIYSETAAPIDWTMVERADMLLVSSITSTMNRAYELIKHIRSGPNSRAPILIGGPHVTFLPEEALQHGADYVFRNEADVSFLQFLEWYEGGKSDPRALLGIRGLSLKIGDQVVHTPPADLVDLDTLPTPNLELVCGYHPQNIPLMTSRGCPYSCEFCVEVPMFGHQYRFRSPEKVLDDLRYYDARYGRHSIFVVDDNYAASVSRLKRLCQEIVSQNLVRPISGQVRLDLAKHADVMQALNLSGFNRAYIGYESINPESLAAVRKQLDVRDMEGFTRIFHRYHIAIHGMFVLGFDDDNLTTVKRTLQTCIRWSLETTQFMILLPIPGSALYDRLNATGRIFTRDWSKYDGLHVTFHPSGMTARQLQAAVYLDAMPRAYNLWYTCRILLADIRRTVSGAYSRRKWRPLYEFRNSVQTFLLRVWGRGVLRRLRQPIERYIHEIGN